MRAVLACLLLFLGVPSARAQTLEYYILEMGWLPGQCLVDPDLADCQGLTLRDLKGRNLTLIGLKPQARPDSTPLQNCDPLARAFASPAIGPGEKATHCSLPPLRLGAELAQSLAAIMPGTADCAERAYWSRYGSCSMLSPQRYFDRAVARATDMQRSLLNAAIAGSIGQRVAREALADAFRMQFGPESEASLQLICARSKLSNQPVLTGLRVSLNQLGTMKALAPASLWSPAGTAVQPAHRCPARFLVAAPGEVEPPLPADPAAPGELVVPPVDPPLLEAPWLEPPPLEPPALPKP